MIVSTLELGPLWVGYGLVGDIVVYPSPFQPQAVC